MKTTAASIVQSANFCGEAPIWNKKTKQLFWVDTGRKECRMLNTGSNESSTITMEGIPQALGMLQSGGWICPMEDRVVLLDKDFAQVKDLGSPLPEGTPLLLGDGTTGPDGLYYFGVYDPEDLSSKEGAVYRVNSDLNFELVIPEMALPNGMAFNKEGDKYYLTEMFGNCIWSYDFSKETGQFTNKSLFASIPEEDGYPDGLIMDNKGGVWSAHWQGFRITRYNPDGKIETVIKLPVPTATCMAFGDNGGLYITTATKGCSDEQLKEYPESGNLFYTETRYKGFQEREFIEK